jgi:type III restriction enzyme
MSSDRYGHKDYQNKTLNSLARYLRRCRETGDPARSFVEVTGELWGAPHPYNRIEGLPEGEAFPADMPFACLRVPTGGGKTVIAARSVRVVRDALLDTEHPLALWLVPSDAIRAQTLAAMRNRDHPLRQVLDEELGAVEILDGEDALQAGPATLGGAATIIVATIQAFRVEKTEGRKVYANNGALMDHFAHIPREAKARFPAGFPHSLANVLRLRRPLVIVDEAHNARSPLSMTVLERFRPRAIIEFTATPETEKNPSNVLHSVSAAELKAEHMVKLPIVLEAQTGFREIVASAIAMRGELEKEAATEREATGEYIRPILLLQAEPRDQGRPDALTVDVVEKALREEHHIPEAQIVVATGERRGLDGVDLNAESCAVRYVITQSALKEGWDCPFAYVLCSVAPLRSATAVEQLLGRVLRMPQAKRKTRAALNRAYAFVRSPHFFAAAEALRDQLVKNAGFDRREAREFFAPRAPVQTELPVAAGGERRRSVTVTLPEPLGLAALSAAARELVADAADGARTVTLAGAPTKATTEALVAQAGSEEAREILRGALAELAAHERVMLAPAERGERFEVPQMMLELDGELVRPDEAEWLEAGWRLPLPPGEQDAPELDAPRPGEAVGVVDVEDGKVVTRQMPELAKEMQLIEVQENWTQTRLVAWLDRNIPHDDIDPQEACAYLDGVVTALLRAHALGRLVRERFELRRRIEGRIAELRKIARRREYQRVLFGADEAGAGDANRRVRVRVGEGNVFAYDPDTYPCREVCKRSREFTKHFYENVGELADTGAEFMCARFLDELPEVKWWVRNLERQPAHAFWLQTSTDRFYPDFVCQLHDGRVLVVEYKGGNLSTGDDAQEKKRLGELWAEKSGGRGFFAMPVDGDYSSILKQVRES